MKANDSRSSDSPFNPPAVIKARALFVIQFFALIGCLGFFAAALAEQDWWFVVPGALCFALMAVIRLNLKRSGQWQMCVDGLNEAYTRPDPLPNHEDGSMRLMDLIDRRDEIESRRGGPKFDPWALQEVRHKIAVLVKNDEALQSLLDDDR
ncbi:MAG TPA: hypothetical protein VL357_13225 [Rariglobus sp.]|jgi:hypothetical protein|nr:hypothetical protein [Rariglobus sp.]